MQLASIFRTYIMNIFKYRTHSVNVACAFNPVVNYNISHLSEYLKDKILNTGVKFVQGEIDLLY